jgi:magnesium-transporting ATPase (P-type)
LALLYGSPIPLLPVQLLWLNLVTNGIQDVALAFEPGVGDERLSPPRPPRESIFNRLMIERTLVAALFMGVVGFGLFQWCLAAGWSEAASRNALLLLMVLFENVHLFNCRSETRSAFAISPLRSPVLMIGMVAAFSIHVAMTYLPAGNVLLATQPVDAALWLQLLMLSLPIHRDGAAQAVVVAAAPQADQLAIAASWSAWYSLTNGRITWSRPPSRISSSL